MAKAKIRKVYNTGIKLILSFEEANFLNDLLYRHVAGAGYYDPGFDAIGQALRGALPENYIHPLPSNGAVVVYGDTPNVGNTAS